MRRLLALATFAAATAPAVACINDSELPSHEREFRSSYLAERPLTTAPDPGYRQYIPAVTAGAGGVLLLGAGFITFRRLTRG